MNDAFQDREKGFERKFQLDQDQQFRVRSRRDRLFGNWVAGKLGLSGPQVDTYAREVVESNIQKPGGGDLMDKVHSDLQAKQVSIFDADLYKALHDCHAEATRQIAAESKK